MTTSKTTRKTITGKLTGWKKGCSSEAVFKLSWSILRARTLRRKNTVQYFRCNVLFPGFHWVINWLGCTGLLQVVKVSLPPTWSIFHKYQPRCHPPASVCGFHDLNWGSCYRDPHSPGASTQSTDMTQQQYVPVPDQCSASPEVLMKNISFLNNFKEKVSGSNVRKSDNQQISR